MLEVVTDAVHRLSSEEWWLSVRDALDGLNPSEVATYQQARDRRDPAKCAQSVVVDPGKRWDGPITTDCECADPVFV